MPCKPYALQPWLGAILLLVTVACHAQKNRVFDHWSFSVSNHHSSKPFHSFSRLLYTDWNPGLSIGPGLNGSASGKWAFYLRLNYFVLQKVQHAVSITSTAGYRIALPGGFYFQPAAGAGVMQAFAASRLWELNENGNYAEKKNTGRTQVVVLVTEQLEKQISKKGHRLTLAYQQSLQAPFINEYVPLLPFNSLSLGITLPNL